MGFHFLCLCYGCNIPGKLCFSSWRKTSRDSKESHCLAWNRQIAKLGLSNFKAAKGRMAYGPHQLERHYVGCTRENHPSGCVHSVSATPHWYTVYPWPRLLHCAPLTIPLPLDCMPTPPPLHCVPAISSPHHISLLHCLPSTPDLEKLLLLLHCVPGSLLTPSATAVLHPLGQKQRARGGAQKQDLGKSLADAM